MWSSLLRLDPNIKTAQQFAMNPIVNFPLLICVLSFVALLISAKAGEAVRRSVRPLPEAGGYDLGIVLTGTLTLLSLIIGFSFSMAASRYDIRKSYEQAEANAIATEYTRTDLLATGDAARIRELLKAYVDQRLLFYTTSNQRQLAKIAADTTKLQKVLWSAVRSSLASASPPLQAVVVSGMNDIVNSQRSTQAAWGNRIPTSAWILMVSIAVGCSFLVGYAANKADWLVFLVMPVMLSISLLLISDLDSPRGGVIRVIPQTLLSLLQSLQVK